jgi:hypothetical protein
MPRGTRKPGVETDESASESEMSNTSESEGSMSEILELRKMIKRQEQQMKELQTQLAGEKPKFMGSSFGGSARARKKFSNLGNEDGKSPHGREQQGTPEWFEGGTVNWAAPTTWPNFQPLSSWIHHPMKNPRSAKEFAFYKELEPIFFRLDDLIAEGDVDPNIEKEVNLMVQAILMRADMLLHADMTSFEEAAAKRNTGNLDEKVAGAKKPRSSWGCYVCGEVGHFAGVCPHKGVKAQPTQSPLANLMGVAAPPWQQNAQIPTHSPYYVQPPGFPPQQLQAPAHQSGTVPSQVMGQGMQGAQPGFTQEMFDKMFAGYMAGQGRPPV